MADPIIFTDSVASKVSELIAEAICKQIFNY